MSMNQSDIHDMYRKYLKIYEDLIMEDAMDQTALKYRNLYGDLGMIFTRFVSVPSHYSSIAINYF